MKRIVFIAEAKQAERFLQEKGVADEIFSLCPSAAYILKKTGHNVDTPAKYYTSESHEHTARIVSRDVERVTECGKKAYGLSEGEISGFRANILYILNWSYYLYFCTQHFAKVEAEFNCYTGNGLEKCTDYPTLFAKFLETTSRRYNHNYENIAYSPLHYNIATLCNKLTLRLSKAADKVRILHFGDSALNKVEQAVYAETKDTVSFKPRVLGKTMAQTLHITLKNIGKISAKKQRQLDYFRTEHPSIYDTNYTEQTKRFAELLNEVEFPMLAFIERLVRDSEWYMPFFKAQFKVGENLARELTPHLAMTNKGKYHFIRAAMYHMPRDRVSILINHGTHTAQPEGSVSQIAANLWASDDRIGLHNVTHVVSKLPLTWKQVQEIYPVNTPRLLKVPSAKRIPRNPAEPKTSFKIVFAGNYFGPLYHLPWCTETAEEYLLAIIELIEAIGGMENVEFIIKLKARKAGTHIQILQERIDALGYGHNIRIDTKTKFLETLKTTHLLISNLSTTIDEALASDVPLLLHTYRKHYFHLPCAFEVAKDGSTGLIYGVKPGQNTRAMIEAIRENYQAIAKNRAEEAGLVWKDSEYNNLQEFAAGITKLASK